MRLERVGGSAVAVEQLLGQAQRDRRAVDHERAGQADRCRDEVVGLVQRADQPAGQRRLGVEDLGGVDPLQRLLDADDPRQEPGRRGLGDDAEPAEDEADPGRGRGEPQVHRQRHGGADADRGPVDRRDHRLWQRVDRQGHLAAGVADRRRTPRRCARSSSGVGRSVSSSPKTLPSADRSIPAQKARPAPVTTTARTASSRASVRKNSLQLARHRQVERVELVGPARASAWRRRRRRPRTRGSRRYGHSDPAGRGAQLLGDLRRCRPR